MNPGPAAVCVTLKFLKYFIEKVKDIKASITLADSPLPSPQPSSDDELPDDECNPIILRDLGDTVSTTSLTTCKCDSLGCSKRFLESLPPCLFQHCEQVSPI